MTTNDKLVVDSDEILTVDESSDFLKFATTILCKGGSWKIVQFEKNLVLYSLYTSTNVTQVAVGRQGNHHSTFPVGHRITIASSPIPGGTCTASSIISIIDLNRSIRFYY